MSYHQIICHIVFGTKYRKSTIPVAHDRELYAYLVGISKNYKCFIHRINGMPDHVHILLALHPSVAPSDLVKAIKQSSSIWMNENPNFPNWEGWAEGYAIRSCSADDIYAIKQYIINQKSHHVNESFAKEYEDMVKSMGYEKVYEE